MEDAGAEPDMWCTRAVHEWAEPGTPHIRLRPLAHQAGMAVHLGRKLRCAAYVFSGL